MEGAGINPQRLLEQLQTNKGLVIGVWGKHAGHAVVCATCYDSNRYPMRLTYLNKFLLSTDYWTATHQQLEAVGSRLSNSKNVLCPVCAGCQDETVTRLWRTVVISSLEEIPPILIALSTSWVPFQASAVAAEKDRLRQAAPVRGELCKDGTGHGGLVVWATAKDDVDPASPPQPPQPPRASTGPTLVSHGTETGTETLADVKELLRDVKTQLEADFKQQFEAFRRSVNLAGLKTHFGAVQSSNSGWEARAHDLEQQIQRLRGEVQTLHKEVNTLRDSRCSSEPAPLW